MLADQHSSDETMEPRENAEHALPFGGDVVQPVQGSRPSSSSSSSSSACSDNIEFVPSPCRGTSENASCAAHPAPEVHGRQNNQRSMLDTWSSTNMRLTLLCQGAELKRAVSVSSQREWLQKQQLHVEDRLREPQLGRKSKTNPSTHPPCHINFENTSVVCLKNFQQRCYTVCPKNTTYRDCVGILLVLAWCWSGVGVMLCFSRNWSVGVECFGIFRC